MFIRFYKMTLLLPTLIIMLSGVPSSYGKVDFKSILQEIPHYSVEQGNAVSERIVANDAEVLHTLCIALGLSTDKAKIEHAIFTVVKYINLPKHGDEKRVVNHLFHQLLNSNIPIPTKLFLVDMLRNCGTKESIPPLISQLKTSALVNQVIYTLTTLTPFDKPAVEAALITTVSTIVKTNQVAAIKALGEIQSHKGIRVILPFANGADTTLKRVALWSLANIGAPEAVPLFDKEITKNGGDHNVRIANYQLLLAKRLLERNLNKKGIKLLYALSQHDEPNIVCAAVTLLCDQKQSNKALDQLRNSPLIKEPRILQTALQLTQQYEPDETATMAWVAICKKSPPVAQLFIIRFLGGRQDETSINYLLSLIASTNTTIAKAATISLATVDDQIFCQSISIHPKRFNNLAAETLLAIFKQCRTDVIVKQCATNIKATWANDHIHLSMASLKLLIARNNKAYVASILHYIDNDTNNLRLEATKDLGHILPTTSLDDFISLYITTTDRKVRSQFGANIVQMTARIIPASARAHVILKKLETAKRVDHQEKLIALLAKVGSHDALMAVSTLANDTKSPLSSAAIKALSKWRSLEAATTLLAIAKRKDASEISDNAFSGYIKLIDGIKRSDSVKIAYYHKALPLAKRGASRNKILGRIKRFKNVDILFNDVDLTGWKGLLAKPNDNPFKRNQLSKETLVQAQTTADISMNNHWHISGNALHFDGKGQSLATVKHYSDFEMFIDWQLLTAKGDSGIYLRGSPQVQIWDPAQHKIGSGALYNNKINLSNPLVNADNPIGQWNTFRIKMVGDKVSVKLNDQLVVDKVVLENYWDRSLPIFTAEQIELQCHGDPISFRNIVIREIKDKESIGF